MPRPRIQRGGAAVVRDVLAQVGRAARTTTVEEIVADMVAMPPTLISTTFTVPADSQMLYREPIRVDGLLIVDGVLIEV